MARKLVMAAMILSATLAHGRGWTEVDSTNGPGQAHWYQLISCAVERCSVVGLTFAFVSSNRVSTGTVVSGYGYATQVVNGVTNLVRWTNYVDAATWVVRTNSLTDGPSSRLLAYLDYMYRQVLANARYCDWTLADGDGSYNSWWASNGVIRQEQAGFLYQVETATEKSPPTLLIDRIPFLLTNTYGRLITSTNVFQVEPDYPDQGAALLVAMATQSGTGTPVVVAGVTSYNYAISFGWAWKVYDALSMNAPEAMYVQLSASEGLVVSNMDVVVTGYRPGSSVRITNVVALSSAAPVSYLPQQMRIDLMTSTWTAVYSSTGTPIRAVVEAYATNALEYTSDQVRTSSGCSQIGGGTVRLSRDAYLSRRAMWDALRWTWYDGVITQAVHKVLSTNWPHGGGDGVCFYAGTFGATKTGVEFSPIFGRAITNKQGGVWQGGYRRVDANIVTEPVVEGYEDTDDTHNCGEAWVAGDSDEMRSISLCSNVMAKIVPLASDVDWYAGFAKRAEIRTRRYLEYDGYNHWLEYDPRFIAGSSGSDIWCSSNYFYFAVDNSRFWDNASHLVTRLETIPHVAGNVYTNFLISPLDAELETIRDDDGVTRSWNETISCGYVYECTYSGTAKYVPEWRYTVRECYAVVKFDVEGGFAYLLEDE